MLVCTEVGSHRAHASSAAGFRIAWPRTIAAERPLVLVDGAAVRAVVPRQLRRAAPTSGGSSSLRRAAREDPAPSKSPRSEG